ncbi:MAG: DUF1499 domain-containing protein [Proteobacteria bacterium]|nr:DUF1499 domain-containing protein [Pseudomonadota bacterium]
MKIILFSLPLFSNLIACTMITPPGELIDGHLRPCPNSPNCVTSDTSATGRIAPISFHDSPDQAWQQIQAIIKDLGGEIVKTRPTYLWATFTSKLFHFVDDVELRMEPEENLIHLRSGARIGYLDFGVNSRRIMKIRQLFLQESKEKASFNPAS